MGKLLPNSFQIHSAGGTKGFFSIPEIQKGRQPHHAKPLPQLRVGGGVDFDELDKRHFIRRLPEGYNTMLRGNGANLSQGQRQLLAIARAAVADPPAMILDEATSSIDTRTEAIVQQGMDALMYGRTTFVIAHRLSTVRNSNAIMVLDHGRIIERGTHEDLLKLKGTYYQLYTGALELD